MVCHVLLCVKEAPNNNRGAGWIGDIRAIKWRDQEGTVHDGCKGTVAKSNVKSTYCIRWLLFFSLLCG